ncbi:MAG: YpmA family protein [Bacillota bacterium]|nr:YpmA family protein [Bacillota bacterium]MDW7685166.1 YpmA family protein [Bacillota bacterium]
MESRGKLELLATLKLKNNDELYRVVDFLNRNLKSHNLMFGMSKNGDEITFSVYEV